MARLANRVARLEGRLAAVRFDPRAVCKLAGQCYESGEPLLADLRPKERKLAECFLNALIMSEA
jgi:hypothetical protein